VIHVKNLGLRDAPFLGKLRPSPPVAQIDLAEVPASPSTPSTTEAGASDSP